METSRARKVWMSQCDVTPSIRTRFGLSAALDYLVSEKLLSFADAAANHPDFAQELPLFVAQVRRLFVPEDIKAHLAALVSMEEDTGHMDIGEDDLDGVPPEVVAARLERLRLLQQLLEAEQLGTS